MGEDTGKKYCPSNGSEGMWFTEKFCMNCIHEKFMQTGIDGDKMCNIVTMTMGIDVKDPAYPSEWTYDEEDKPICTKWKSHNWHKDENGNWNDPQEPEPINPNQLNLF